MDQTELNKTKTNNSIDQNKRKNRAQNVSSGACFIKQVYQISQAYFS